jgi:hypothetical protein
MKNLSEMNANELTAVLQFTTTLAERARFAQNGSVSDVSDTTQTDIADARKRAEAYARAVNSGARARRYETADENAKDGVRSALDWLSRKKKSAIK